MHLKQLKHLTVVGFVLLMLCGLLYVGIAMQGVRADERHIPAGAPTPPGYFYSDQEDAPLGDWEQLGIYDVAAGAYVTRSTTAYSGMYSYEYHSDANALEAWAQTFITCETPMYEGHIEAWVMLPVVAEPDAYPGIPTANRHGVLSIYHFSSWNAIWTTIPVAGDFLDVYFDNPSKRFIVACAVCYPDQEWDMGDVHMGEWYHITVDWSLPEGTTAGWLRAQQGDTIWVDESGITTETGGAYKSPNAGGAGVKGWHHFFSDGHSVLIDEVSIWGCDLPIPTPTPTPTPGVYVCDQYGHASVLNVDDDCSAVLRFSAIPNYVSHDSVVTRATLYLYGVSVEQDDSTIYVAPLTTVWGEMTCDWCRRTVGEAWALPGATSVPEDRFPGSVAEFTAALGWVEVDIPTYIVEEWAMTSAANPGFVLSNAGLTGKYGIASREWVDADYRPYMVVYYTE